jgi:G3E family GTPase
LREDVLPLIARLAGEQGVAGVVLVLPEAVEPLGFLEAFASVVLEGSTKTASDHLEVAHLVQVLGPGDLVELLESQRSLAESGLGVAQDDNRRHAEVLVAGIEAADVIVAPDIGPREVALLRVLNADAEIVDAANWTASFDWERLEHRTDCARPLVVGSEAELEGIWAFTWISDRPLHPGRLHACLEDFGESVRGRGTIHLASRPTVPVVWDSVGSRISLGLAGDGASEFTVVSFMGLSGRPEILRARLVEATLDDLEMSAGPGHWRHVPDPFAELWLAHESEDV